MSNINLTREKIIFFKKKYLANLKKKNIDIESSSLISLRYLIFSKLKKNNNYNDLAKKIKKINFINQLKNILYLKNFSSINLHGNYSKKNLAKYNKIILSWSYFKNFKKSGIFTDPYFKVDSNKKKLLWVLIHMENNLPAKINDNIIIIHPFRSNIILGLVNLINYIFKLILKHKLKINNIYHNLSYDSYLSSNIKDFFIKKKFLDNTKKIFIPLESQPFQNQIIQLAKIKKIHTVGFDHTCNPFPFYNTYSHLSPDTLQVHGKCSSRFYSKYLNWPKKKISITNSVRVIKKNKNFFLNKIFLPILIDDFDKILLTLDNFFQSYLSKKKIKPLKVCLHPATINLQKYRNLKKSIYKLQKKYSGLIKPSNKTSISVHVGNISTIVEASELKTEVIHIVSSDIFDYISPQFWYTVKAKEILNNIFKYKLKKYGHCVAFKRRTNTLNF